MNEKKKARMRRAGKTRAKIRVRGIDRLCVWKTPQHIYAAITVADGSRSLACVSSTGKAMREARQQKSKRAVAEMVGQRIAERARSKNIERVAFDRSGFKYHGRIKALADAARANGLKF